MRQILERAERSLALDVGFGLDPADFVLELLRRGLEKIRRRVNDWAGETAV